MAVNKYRRVDVTAESITVERVASDYNWAVTLNVDGVSRMVIRDILDDIYDTDKKIAAIYGSEL